MLTWPRFSPLSTSLPIITTMQDQPLETQVTMDFGFNSYLYTIFLLKKNK